MKLKALLIVSLFAMPAFSVEGPSDCPNARALRGMCMFVGSGTEDGNPQGEYRYLYQRKLFEAACVDPIEDSEAEIQVKMAKMWSVFEDKLICNNPRFDVQDGNIVKFGVTVQFDRFIYDIAKWKVNLNKVDEWDQMTVLDYVQKEMDRHKGNSLERNLRSYYRALREAGAKHKWEL